MNKIGSYKITYTATGPSGATNTIEREVKVVASGDSFSNYRLDEYTSNDVFSKIKNIFNRKYYD